MIFHTTAYAYLNAKRSLKFRRSIGVLLNQCTEQRYPLEQMSRFVKLLSLSCSEKKTRNIRLHERENDHKCRNVEIKDEPASMTKTRSQSMTVGILWAMLMMVQDAKSSRMIFWMSPSVCESTDAVASSINRSRLFFSITRPRHRSCLCPTLQLSPLSTTINKKRATYISHLQQERRRWMRKCMVRTSRVELSWLCSNHVF